MANVLIFGAGSIGNHLAYACRTRGWDVTITDTDPEALNRTKNDIYPSRYKAWDDGIKLVTPDRIGPDRADLVIIGTPPDTHIKLALDVLKKAPPRIMLIEKPLATPSLEGCDELLKLSELKKVRVLVGYNHTLTKNTRMAEEKIRQGILGEPLALTAMFREHWGGIFSAHPWLAGPRDSYLGFFRRGGGATGEHSHAINIWQHFAHALGKGRITEVTAVMEMVKQERAEYDRISLISVRTEKGFTGDIAQDVITRPTKKYARLQGDKGALEWFVNYDKTGDALFTHEGTGEPQKEIIAKTRPDDFKTEIDHVEGLLADPAGPSPVSLQRGLETMMVIAAAYVSREKKRTVRIDYKKGFNLKAIC